MDLEREKGITISPRVRLQYDARDGRPTPHLIDTPATSTSV